MKSYRFKIPFEHGAWWSFLTTLIACVIAGFWQGSAITDIVLLAAIFSLGFVLQDWVQALLSALLKKSSQAISQWQAVLGWLLLGCSLVLSALFILLQPQEKQLLWTALFVVLALSMCLGIASRIYVSQRGRKSLAFTALLLSIPALPFGLLFFGFHLQAIYFWFWPMLYYPIVTLAAQSFIRGYPQRARWLASVLGVVLGLLAIAYGGLWAGLILILQGLHLGWAIRQRWINYPQGLPPGPQIKSLGKTQAAYSIVLSVLWLVFFFNK